MSGNKIITTQSARKVGRGAKVVGKRSRIVTHNVVTITAPIPTGVVRIATKGKKTRNLKRNTGTETENEAAAVLERPVGDATVLNILGKLSEQIDLMAKRIDGLENRREINAGVVASIGDC